MWAVLRSMKTFWMQPTSRTVNSSRCQHQQRGTAGDLCHSREKRIRHWLFKWSSSSKSSSRGYRDHHFLCLHDSGGSERIFTDHNIPRSSKPVILIYLEKQPHKKRTAAYPFFISGGFDLVFCLSRTIHPVPQLLHGSGAS